jgi:L-threonylcarbamoyladenylate synthase
LILSKKSDLNEAASNVFSFLREADEMEGNEIFALKLPEVGLGLAINDRLHRAAAK